MSLTISEESKGFFWQVQSKVDQDTIKRFTSDCERDDCMISARMVGETTCLGTSDFYDKEGRLIIHDRNQYNVALTCGKCWKSAIASNLPRIE